MTKRQAHDYGLESLLTMNDVYELLFEVNGKRE